MTWHQLAAFSAVVAFVVLMACLPLIEAFLIDGTGEAFDYPPDTP